MEIQFNEEEIQKRLLAKRKKKLGLPDDATPAPAEEQEKDDAPIRHFMHGKVRTLIGLRRNTWLTGPAGTGKSKIAEIVAEELSLPFHCPPIGRETTNAQLFGYFNAAGNYVRTPIREACENGGVLHLEEIDFASAAVGTALNALLANDVVGFPDGVVRKHKDFIVIASANTYGTGSNATYIGSQGLNAATLNRFVFVEIGYDLKMERRIAPCLPWCSHVQEIRRKVEKLGLKHVISPRQTIDGGLMINSKEFSWEEVERMTLWKNLDDVTVNKIKQAVV